MEHMIQALPKNYSHGLRILLSMVISSMVLVSCEVLESGPETIDDVWRCQEESQVFGFQAYDVNISYLPNDSTVVRMANFYNLGTGKVVTGEVDLWDLSINTQTVEGLVFNGSGVISGNLKKIDLFVMEKF